MKAIRFLFLAMIIFLTSSFMPYAQEVIVMIQHPPFNQLKNEDLWKLTLINTTTRMQKVFLKGTITESQAGLILTGVSKSFDLPPGTKIFTAANYRELGPDIDYVNKDSRYKESVIRSGGFPSGDYEICVYAIDEATKAELSTHCINQQILLAVPPSLISPDDGSDVSIKYPDFIWLPSSATGGVNYIFKLVEILSGQSIYEAIEKNLAFYTTTLRQTMLKYPVQGSELMEGRRYAWRVQSVDENGNPVGSNNGFSEVWSFTFTKISSELKSKITRQQAIDIIIKKIIVPPTLDHDVTAFLGMNPLEPGVAYYPYSYDELEKKIENPVWFGWINDSPQAFFAHSTRYVFIDVRTGSYTIETYNWWPVINGKSLWMGDEENSNPDVLIFSTIHFK